MLLRPKALAFSLLAAFAALAQAAPPAPARPVLITADKVWTGEDAAHAGWGVLVSHNRIQAVGPLEGITVPLEAERIALPGRTV